MSQEITIEIDEQGDVKVATKGFKGKSCKDATKQLEEALGHVASDKPTEEMYERTDGKSQAKAY